MRQTAFMVLLGLISFVAGSGCGDGTKSARPKLFPVSGTVHRNGKPVENATVAFVTENASRNAMGQTDAQGKFRLGTFGNADGAIAGDHVVIVSKVAANIAPATTMSPEELSKMVGSGKMVAPKIDESIPAKYADPKTTPLKATVKGDGQDSFTFDLVD